MERKENMAKKDRVGKAQGTFRKKDNGSLEYRFYYTDLSGERHRKCFGAKDMATCLEKADRFLEKLERMRAGVLVDATIPSLIRHKLEVEFRKNYFGEQGYRRSLFTLQVIERSAIGRIPIAELTVPTMDIFLQSITHYSQRVISKVYQQVKTAFSIALDKGIIERNIMTMGDLRCPRSDKKTKKVRGFTPAEQERFLEAIEAYPVPEGRNNYKLQLLIELYTGMRMGEINALKPEHVDFEAGYIHVKRTVSVGLKDRTFIKEGTKTYSGQRDVPINKMVEPLLKEAIAKMKKNPEGLIFYDHNKGDLIITSQVNSFFRRLCAKAGVENFGQHSLRHTFATRCIEAGVPPVVLKKWLGHSNIHITLDTYADIFDKMHTDSMSKFENYLLGDVG